MPTAAFIAIGDEILAGKFADENSPFMIKRLRAQGVDLKRVAIIPDDLNAIAEEVRRCSQAYDHVFTSGGVGPTHDDITLEAVAMAFGEELVLFDEIVRILNARYKDSIPEPALRMARLPSSAKIHWEEGLRFPLVSAHNVFIFPGVPSFLRIKFEAGAHRWVGKPFHLAQVRSWRSEVEIADILSRAQAEWPTLSVGSYPRFEAERFHVLATIEGRNQGDVEACRAWIEAAFAALPEKQSD
jgi:molybdenum cofactor synthesis domain-containing protein